MENANFEYSFCDDELFSRRSLNDTSTYFTCEISFLGVINKKSKTQLFEIKKLKFKHIHQTELHRKAMSKTFKFN